MTKFFDTLMAFSFGLPVFFPFWLLGLLIRSFYCLFHRCLSSTICLLLYFFYFNSIKLSLSWNENGEITKREIGKIVFVFFVVCFILFHACYLNLYILYVFNIIYSYYTSSLSNHQANSFLFDKKASLINK